MRSLKNIKQIILSIILHQSSDEIAVINVPTHENRSNIYLYWKKKLRSSIHIAELIQISQSAEDWKSKAIYPMQNPAIGIS